MRVRRAARGALLALLCLLPCAAPATPHDLVLMLDNSGSMRENDPDFLTRLAVRAFLDGLDGDYHVAIVAFDERVSVLMSLTPLDGVSRQRFLDSLDAITYSGQLTNSPAALERSLYELREFGRPDASKSIVFMTDGIVDVAPQGADPGDVEKARWMKTTLADAAADADVRIFGIAFTDNADFELLQTLARRSAGDYYRAYTAADIDSVFVRLRERLDAARAAPPAEAGAATAPLPAAEPNAAPAADAAAAESMARPAATDDPARGGAPSAAAPLPAPTGVPPPTSAPPLPELPPAVLPQAELPAVELPAVTLPGDPSRRAPDPATPAAGDSPRTAPGPSPGTPDPSPEPLATPSPVGEQGSEATPVSREPAQPEAGAPILLALAGVALLLALAAFAVAMARRRARVAAPAPAGPVPRAYLNDIDGATAANSYEIGARPVMLGRLRGPESQPVDHVIIDESTVGRQHALIEYRDHAFWITDQNSLNGTFVNNARIEAPTRLKHGDRIRIHRHEFEFLVLDMFETDRTMMSETVFADHSGPSTVDDDDATEVREEGVAGAPSPRDPTVTRA